MSPLVTTIIHLSSSRSIAKLTKFQKLSQIPLSSSDALCGVRGLPCMICRIRRRRLLGAALGPFMAIRGFFGQARWHFQVVCLPFWHAHVSLGFHVVTVLEPAIRIHGRALAPRVRAVVPEGRHPLGEEVGAVVAIPDRPVHLPRHPPCQHHSPAIGLQQSLV